MFSLEMERLLTSLGSGSSIYYPCSYPLLFCLEDKVTSSSLCPAPSHPPSLLGFIGLRSCPSLLSLFEVLQSYITALSRWMSSHFLQGSPSLFVCVREPDREHGFSTLFLQSHLTTLPNTHAGLHPWYLYCVFELFIAPWLIVVVSWGDVPLEGCSDAMRSFLPLKTICKFLACFSLFPSIHFPISLSVFFKRPIYCTFCFTCSLCIVIYIYILPCNPSLHCSPSLSLHLSVEDKEVKGKRITVAV